MTAIPTDGGVTDERFPGDIPQPPDTRHFQLVCAVVQGILANKGTMNPDTLAKLSVDSATAIMKHLKKRQ